jgi:hypothetical protein
LIDDDVAEHTFFDDDDTFTDVFDPLGTDACTVFNSDDTAIAFPRFTIGTTGTVVVVDGTVATGTVVVVVVVVGETAHCATTVKFMGRCAVYGKATDPPPSLFAQPRKVNPARTGT